MVPYLSPLPMEGAKIPSEGESPDDQTHGECSNVALNRDASREDNWGEIAQTSVGKASC